MGQELETRRDPLRVSRHAGRTADILLSHCFYLDNFPAKILCVATQPY